MMYIIVATILVFGLILVGALLVGSPGKPAPYLLTLAQIVKHDKCASEE